VALCGGYPTGMSELEQFISDVEVSIVDSVDSLGEQEAAVLYAGVLDFEKRLDALRDALTLMAVGRT
jgi:hypothetical protein